MHNDNQLLKQIEQHVYELAVNIGERPTGSVANRKAENYITEVFRHNGFQVELQGFNCIDWEKNQTTLIVKHTEVPAESTPYSLPCDVRASIEAIANFSQLEKANLEGKIALLGEELTQEPLMPKNFRFYNPEHHQKIISLLEKKNPTAILTASLNDEHLVSIFEDGDFNIPSAVVSKQDEDTIVQSNLPIHLKINSRRKNAIGANVIARKNQTDRNKFVVTAHFDTKPGTPGALDNATGVALLLALSEMYKDTVLEDVNIELVAFNGEDYFSTPGQVIYLDTYGMEFNQIELAINCDGLGLNNSKIGISLMECPKTYSDRIESVKQVFHNIETLPPWYQGDHMLFVWAKVPTLAITSIEIFKLMDNVIHTENDCLDLIDPELILEACFFIREIMNSERKTAK
ncbi:MAG: M28 family peptidase [Cyanobacteria bacterium P01_E01_bin.35]